MLKNIEKFLANVQDSQLSLYIQCACEGPHERYVVAQLSSEFWYCRASTEQHGLLFAHALNELDHVIANKFDFRHCDPVNAGAFDSLAERHLADRENLDPVSAVCAHLGGVRRENFFSCVISGGRNDVARADSDPVVRSSLYEALVDALRAARPRKANRSRFDDPIKCPVTIPTPVKS